MRRHLLGGTSLAALTLVVQVATAVAGPQFPIGKPAPDFTLTDQTGATVRLSQFKGKLVLLNFIYTRCVDVCPITTANLAQVQRQLIRRGWWAQDVIFLSVTTDPAYDSPPILAAYGKKYHADPRGWHFLTGRPDVVRRVYASYGVEVRSAPKGLQEHLLPTFMIDRTGKVLGAYGVNPDPANVLKDLEHLR